MIAVWIVLGVVVVGGGAFAVALAALQHWVAFVLFLLVYVIGVVATTVQVVTTT